MAARAARCECGLRDFASALDAVIARMHDALGKATAGGLRVDGPFIVEPEPVPMSAPGAPIEICTPQNMHTVLGRVEGDVNEYNCLLADYNAKIAVFNECKGIVDAARTAEGNAHHALREAMQAPEGQSEIDGRQIGTMVIARVNGYVSSFENPRAENLLKAQRAEGHAQFFENWAKGTKLNLSDSDKALLQWGADHSRANRDAYERRTREFGKYVNKVPEPIRKGVAAYPGKNKIHMLPDDATAKLRGAQKVLKGMPYVGSGLTIANEIWDASTGEQSWGKTAADSGGMILGGSLGAAGTTAAATAAYGAPFGPLGVFLTGTTGGLVGMVAGQKVADYFVPE